MIFASDLAEMKRGPYPTAGTVGGGGGGQGGPGGGGGRGGSYRTFKGSEQAAASHTQTPPKKSIVVVVRCRVASTVPDPLLIPRRSCQSIALLTSCSSCRCMYDKETRKLSANAKGEEEEEEEEEDGEERIHGELM